MGKVSCSLNKRGLSYPWQQGWANSNKEVQHQAMWVIESLVLAIPITQVFFRYSFSRLHISRFHVGIKLGINQTT